MTRSTGLGLLVDTGMSYRPDTVTGVYELGSLVVTLPALVVLVVGLVLVSPRRLPGRGPKLARAGLVVLLGQLVLGLLWSALLPRVVIRSGYASGALTVRGVGYLNAAVGFLLDLVLAAGLALLIAGLMSGLRARAPGASSPPPGVGSFPAPAGYQTPVQRYSAPPGNYPAGPQETPSSPSQGHPATATSPRVHPATPPTSSTLTPSYPAPDPGSFPPPQAYQPPTGSGSSTPPHTYQPPTGSGSSTAPHTYQPPTGSGSFTPPPHLKTVAPAFSPSGDVPAGRREANSGEHYVPLPDEHTPAEEDSSGHDMDHGADLADGSTHRIVSRAQDPWSHIDGH